MTGLKNKHHTLQIISPAAKANTNLKSQSTRHNSKHQILQIISPAAKANTNLKNQRPGTTANTKS